MESTAADAMPDDTALTPQASDTEPSPSADNPVMELALKDLQQRRDALEAEIAEMTSRKQQLEAELKTSFAGQSDAIARRVKGFQEYLGGQPLMGWSVLQHTCIMAVRLPPASA